jgi:hypothetical protein
MPAWLKFARKLEDAIAKNDYPNARDCEHGQQRGKCRICELESELAECKAENERLMVENKSLHEYWMPIAKRIERLLYPDDE